MNVVLWIVQSLLAVAFLIAGGMKLGMPIEDLAASGFTFVEQVPAGLVRFIGLAEITGAVGLILPSLLRIQPKLTAVAAGALAFVMLLAVITHLWLGETMMVWVPLTLGLLAAFVAWGRSTKAEINEREEPQRRPATAST